MLTEIMFLSGPVHGNDEVMMQSSMKGSIKVVQYMDATETSINVQ